MKNGLHDFKRLSSLEFVSIECLFNLFRGNARGNVEGREWRMNVTYEKPVKNWKERKLPND